MLPQQLRQRGLYAAFCPGPALKGAACSLHHELRAFSSDGGQQERGSSSATPVLPAHNTASDAIGSESRTVQGDGLAVSGQTKAPAQPSLATATAMAGLRSRLAASQAAPDGPRSALGPPPGNSRPLPSKAAVQAVQPSADVLLERHQQPVEFQRLPLQLGEPGNPLQSMAVLTYTDVRQLTEYGKNPLASDQRFLASLHKMASAPQQRAAAIMQMAAGAVPPPAVLVWAAQEVVEQVRLRLRERLAQQQQDQLQEIQQQAAQRPAGAAVLVLEPWYKGALQLARLTLAAVPRTANQHQQLGAAQPVAPSEVRTELELLAEFARGREAAAGAQQAPPSPSVPQTAEPYGATWDALLALPQLHALLEVAASRSTELAVVLELSGLRPADDVTTRAAAAPAAALDMSSAGTSGSGRGGGGPGAQRQEVPAAQEPEAQAAPVEAAAVATGDWLLPALRSAVAAARVKALRVAGWAAEGAGAQMDVEGALRALAVGAPHAGGAAAPPPSASLPEQRVAAADWLAAATLLGHAEERLGCASDGVRQEAVAALNLLGLPLEPRELLYMDELKVSEQELRGWMSQLSVQLAAGGTRADGSALPIPPSLELRLSTAHQRLAAAGRALALAAPERTLGEPSRTPEATATLTWLRAVGAPLVSGLLSGGYGSLSRLRAMVPELREALVLRLLEIGRVQGGTTALTAALYSDAEAAWRTARTDGSGAGTAVDLLHQEAVAAELDLLHERYVATPPAPPPPRPLPTDAALAAAVQALPPPARLLYDSYYVLRADGGDDPAVVQERRRVADALAAAGEGAVLAGLGDLKVWLGEARKGLLLLPPPLLALLLRFLRVQVSVTPEEAQSQRNKLTALAILVAEQQRRAATAVAGGEGGRDGQEAATAAAAVAAREVAEWSRSGGGGGSAPGAGGRVPAALAALLGPSGALDFTSWLQAVALSSSSSQLSTHQLLAQQHMQMDVERYLTMTHDPRLHLPLSGIGQAAEGGSSPSPPSCRPTSATWTDPALRRSEAPFLEDMRPQLDAYLRALGHRPMGEAEWTVYRDAALEEWAEGGSEREERVAAAGHSGFFNPRADEVYLQQMLESSIALGDPLGPQSRRYLDTLLRNPSWSFAQRRQAVQRLIQLNAHFARQSAAPEGGSPFAPLFAVGGPELVPTLGPLREGQEGRTGRRGEATIAAGEVLRLPKGF